MYKTVFNLILFSAVLLPLLAAPPVSAQGLISDGSAGSGTRQVIVKFSGQSSFTPGERNVDTFSTMTAAEQSDFIADAQALTGHPVAHLREMWGRADVFVMNDFAHERDFQQALADLQSMPDVSYAIADALATTTVSPNDPLYPQQWHYYEPLAGLGLSEGWEITTGSPVIIGVVDTGYRNHSDINSRLLPGYDLITSATRAEDGDGRDSDPLDVAPRFISGYGQLYHGIHVAGTATTNSNNNQGVAGVSWGARIVPVRVLNNDSGGTLSDIIDGIAWAAGQSVPGVPNNANPADIINLSLGAFSPSTCPNLMQQVINTAEASGILIVAGAGNNNAEASLRWPVNCNNTLVVAGVSRTGDRAYYSNFGSVVDVSAPAGEDFTAEEGILSLGGDGDYKYLFGTSMAAPHVSGLAALMLSTNPQLSPAQLRSRISQHARNFPAGSTCNSSQCGAGIADAKLVLQALNPQPGHAVKVIASYMPGPPGGHVRQSYELNTQQSPTLDIYFNEGAGTFQQRPGGVCNSGQNNSTYFMIKVDSPHVQSCTFWGSWDSAPVQCNSAQLQTANNGDWVIINTDRYETNPATCTLFQPLRSLVPFETDAWFEVNLKVNGINYKRRMNFKKMP